MGMFIGLAIIAAIIIYIGNIPRAQGPGVTLDRAHLKCVHNGKAQQAREANRNAGVEIG